MATVGELACTYAALTLHDDGIPITAEKITAIAKAANVTIVSYWPPLFAKLVEKRSVDDLISSIGSVGAGSTVAAVVAAAPSGGAAPVAAPAAEEKKEEPEEESDGDIGGLFGDD